MTRCEGMVRTGGAFTIGRPRWDQCTKEAVVNLTIEQTSGGFGHTATEGIFPACKECWERALKTEGVKVLFAMPIKSAVSRSVVHEYADMRKNKVFGPDGTNNAITKELLEMTLNFVAEHERVLTKEEIDLIIEFIAFYDENAE